MLVSATGLKNVELFRETNLFGTMTLCGIALVLETKLCCCTLLFCGISLRELLSVLTNLVVSKNLLTSGVLKLLWEVFSSGLIIKNGVGLTVVVEVVTLTGATKGLLLLAGM